MPTEAYDAIIIGSGQGGVPLAVALAGAGWKTALIERGHVGGTCINTGCTPTKTIVASAEVAHQVRHADDMGVRVGQVSVDMAEIRQRKRDIVESFRGGSERRVEEADGLDLIRGEARFTGAKTLEVRLSDGGTRQLAADNIFIDTGARPRVPAIPGLDRVDYLDNVRIMELDKAPSHLIVLGGGYIGLEFAQAFRRFGSQVTVVQRAGQLLTREDGDVAGEVLKILQEDGIEIRLDAELKQVEPGPDGGLRAMIATPDGQRTLVGSHLLLAVGRVPNTDALDLPAAGVEADEQGFVRVNDRLETNVPGIYALGDVKGGPAFTHISYDDYRVLRANLLDGGQASIKDRMVPYVVFIDPQLARIGLSEGDAKRQGRRYKVATLPMSYVARAIETDNPRGLMKAVVDADSGQILGCVVLGMDAGEVMPIVQVAMMGKLPYTALRDGIFAHPTVAEALNNLFAKI